MKGKKGAKRPKKAETTPRANVVVPFPTPAKSHPTDHTQWLAPQMFRFRLRNGFTGRVFLEEKQIDRLWFRVQQPDHHDHFVVFNSAERRMALNLRHLVASQFDYIGEDGLDAKDIYDGEDVEIVFADSKKPLHLEVEPDEMTIEEFDDGGEDDNDLCQMANLFYYLELAHEGTDYAQRLRITDRSIIWLRLNDIAFASVPLSLFPEHWREESQDH